MRSLAPLNSTATRFAASALALLLTLSLVGCDQVQDMVDGEADSATPANTTPAAAAPKPAQPAPAPTPAQPAAPPDPAQVLATFQAIPPRDITEAALQRVADVPEAAAGIAVLDMTGAPVGRGAMALLAKFPNLETVNLSNVRPPTGGLAGFSPESTFIEIDVANTPIDDAGVASLAGVKSLTRINLSNSAKLSPAGLIPLGNLDKLIDLDLSFGNATDQITPVLARLPLERLNLAKTRITDASLQQLAQINTLRDLNLSFCAVHGATFRVFKGAKLTRLWVGETQFGADGMAAIRGMTTLEDLNVYRAGIVQRNDALVLGSLPNLGVLNIGSNKLTDVGMGFWFKGKAGSSIEELNISGHKALVTNRGLAALVRMKNLKHVDCRDTGVTVDGANALKKELPEVEVTDRNGTRH